MITETIQNQPTPRELPADVWINIIEHCQIPPPLPLSKPPGFSYLSQPHLAALMRTSKLLQSCTEPILYRDIYTYCLSQTLAEWHSPIPDRRFGLTKSLHLEYFPRDREPTYKLVLETPREGGIWEMYGLVQGWTPALYRRHCQQEITNLTECLEKMAKAGTAFPKLETVAIDAIQTQGAGIWRAYELTLHLDGDTENPMKCARLFNRFLAKSARHVCLRGSHGPLGLNFIGHALTYDSPRYHTTVHFSRDTTALSLPHGSKVNWVCDEPPSADLADVLTPFGRAIAREFEQQSRMVAWTAEHNLASLPDCTDLDIYCSTDKYGPKIYDLGLAKLGLKPLEGGPTQFTDKIMARTEKEEIARTLQKKIQKLFRDASGRQDEVRWHSMEKTPRCKACGMGPPV